MRKSGNPVWQLLGRILTLVALISALTLAPTRPSGAQEVTANWSYTGSLNAARTSHTATLLADGKVLVVGGYTNSAELYDPSTGTWSLTGSLNVGRVGHTATLLGNGKVLVAGGYDIIGDESEPVLTNTAVLYDLATGESRFTGNLNVRRSNHTATLLLNGKVLIAGGVMYEIAGIEEFATNTAELYDPVTGQWSLIGNLNTARFEHTAALLQNGKVLVAGGCPQIGSQAPTTSAEVYDPDTETWSSTGSLNTPRSRHAMTMLPNGNVLLAGGAGQFFPFLLNTVEIYNPASGL